MDILKSPQGLKRSLKAHEKIIRSFEDRDAEKAEKLRKESILVNIEIFASKFKKKKKEMSCGE